MVTAVSSATSCISAAEMLSLSMPSSIRIWATHIGWQIYGSPLRRRWPSWAFSARA